MISRIFKIIFLFPSHFYNYYKEQQLTLVKQQFAGLLSFFKANTDKDNNDGMALVQMVKDYEYTIKLAAASKALAEKNNLVVNIYDTNWKPWAGWANKYKVVYEKLFTSFLNKMYFHFGNEIVFKCEDKYNDQAFIKHKLAGIKKELKQPQDILNLRFEGIAVGDLVYDHYLRHFHQPTIEEFNDNIWITIEVALNMFYNFQSFLNKNKVKALINTYTSYLHHGIPARLCLERDIEVYSIGSNSYIIQKLSKEFPYHQINHTLFSPDKKLSEKQLNEAKQKFTVRFEGKIDAATSYMRTSAFSDKPFNEELKKLFATRKRNIIIYVHDFYDSPHVNRMLQFPDLYQFLKQTLIAIEDIKDTNVFIKTHPNGIKGCKEITIELVNNFNKDYFHILDENTSNLNIIELRPDLIVTARGTVCLEMAYFEIPAVALYDNLYTSFNFTHTCSNKELYFSVIKGETKPSVDYNKEKIYSFYYQAFLDKVAKGENNIFNKLTSFKGDTYNDKYIEFALMQSKEIASDKFVKYYNDGINE